MKIKLTLTLCLVCCLANSQITELFDRNFQKKTNDVKSKKKREYFISDTIIKIKDFRSDKLYRVGEFIGFDDLRNLDKFIWYNANMQYDKDPTLKLNNRQGRVLYFSENGEKISEQIYQEDKVKYVQLWIDNKAYLTNGTGKYFCNSKKRNEKIVRVFKDSIEIESFVIRNELNDTIYSKTDTHAYPKYGLKKFYSYLASNIDYPKFANSLGIQKKVTIEFVIDETGKLTDFVPISNKSLSFEKKVIKRLEKMPKWNPASFGGKFVKTRFRIPITFKK